MMTEPAGKEPEQKEPVGVPGNNREGQTVTTPSAGRAA
jgi:hypothetical protein